VDKEVERRVPVGDEGKKHICIDDHGTDDCKRNELREPESISENGRNKRVSK
jgi:hypothetical protein